MINTYLSGSPSRFSKLYTDKMLYAISSPPNRIAQLFVCFEFPKNVSISAAAKQLINAIKNTHQILLLVIFHQDFKRLQLDEPTSLQQFQCKVSYKIIIDSPLWFAICLRNANIALKFFNALLRIYIRL